MRRDERTEDPYVAALSGLLGLQADIQTSMPAIIQSFDPATQTCTAQPCLQMLVTNPDNTKKWVTIALIVDIPVVFPAGGGFTLTFPVKRGDECLLVFSSRCIDAWWVSGKISQQAELRMHDISDGFAFVGVRSIPRMIPNISTNSVQLRSDDSETYVEIAPNGLVRVQADDIETHAKYSHVQDVHGYGQKITWTGGSNYTIDNYVIGATITTNNLPINPPDAT
jgi:hypothetical protein